MIQKLREINRDVDGTRYYIAELCDNVKVSVAVDVSIANDRERLNLTIMNAILEQCYNKMKEDFKKNMETIIGGL